MLPLVVENKQHGIPLLAIGEERICETWKLGLRLKDRVDIKSNHGANLFILIV